MKAELKAEYGEELRGSMRAPVHAELIEELTPIVTAELRLTLTKELTAGIMVEEMRKMLNAHEKARAPVGVVAATPARTSSSFFASAGKRSAKGTPSGSTAKKHKGNTSTNGKINGFFTT